MNPESLNILHLHDVDSRIFEAKRQLKSYPKKIGALQADVQLAQENLQRATEALQKARATRGLIETDIKHKQETIAKFLNQQMQVKTNKEYQAINHQVDTLRGEISDRETEVLEAMDHEENLESHLNEARDAVKHAEREAQRETERLSGLEDEKKSLLERLKAERAQWAGQTPEDILEKYEGLFERFPANAVVPEVNSACGGCHMNLLAHTMQELHESNSLVPCPHCHRLLYPPEARKEARI